MDEESHTWFLNHFELYKCPQTRFIIVTAKIRPDDKAYCAGCSAHHRKVDLQGATIAEFLAQEDGGG